jgi:hypothetical protein
VQPNQDLLGHVLRVVGIGHAPSDERLELARELSPKRVAGHTRGYWHPQLPPAIFSAEQQLVFSDDAQQAVCVAGEQQLAGCCTSAPSGAAG